MTVFVKDSRLLTRQDTLILLCLDGTLIYGVTISSTKIYGCTNGVSSYVYILTFCRLMFFRLTIKSDDANNSKSMSVAAKLRDVGFSFYFNALSSSDASFLNFFGVK